LKKVKLDKDKPFGASVAKKFSPGNMVEWTGWYLDVSGECKYETYKGVLIEIISETFGGREVLYGKILPINNNIIFEVNIFCLRKVKDEETT